MTRKQASDIYQQCMNMDISEILDIIDATPKGDEKSFYVDLCNHMLEYRQQECIKNGVF